MRSRTNICSNQWPLDHRRVVRENVARYINHPASRTPNPTCAAQAQGFSFRAIRNIEPGEEINLRLRYRLLQGLSEADRLQMCGV